MEEVAGFTFMLRWPPLLLLLLPPPLHAALLCNSIACRRIVNVPRRTAALIAMDDGSDASLDEARAYLGLSDEKDVETYLRAGSSLLGRQLAILVPTEGSPCLEEAFITAVTKAIKLGGSVVLLTESSNAGKQRLLSMAKRLPYPRIAPAAANFTSPSDVARALRGSNALLLCAAQPASRRQVLVEALSLLEQEVSRAADGGVRAAGGVGTGAVGPYGVPQQAYEGIEQLVLLSSVEIYGAPDQLSASIAAGAAAACVADADGACAMEEWDEPQPTEAAALALLASERALSACCKRTAILRATTLVGGQSNGLQSILSDAMGLKELLVEYLAELHAKTGLASGPSAAAAAAAAASAAFEQLMPDGRRVVQLTHADDLGAASVFALLSGLDGSFHVCSPPATLQQVFDSIAEQKGWPELRLRGPAEVQPAADEDDSTDGPNTPVFSTRKLREAGYELVWPDVCTPPSPEDSESASADCGPAGADTESADPTRAESPAGGTAVVAAKDHGRRRWLGDRSKDRAAALAWERWLRRRPRNAARGVPERTRLGRPWAERPEPSLRRRVQRVTDAPEEPGPSK